MTTDERTANFTTSCEPCVFCQWSEGKQTGCDMGRLDKFIKKNKAEKDDNANFYTITTICNVCRGPEWAINNVGKNLIALVEKEIRLSMDFILISIDDNKDKLLKTLPNLIKKCVHQEQIRPKQIILVLRHNDINSQDIYDILHENCDGVDYKLVRVLEYTASIYRCLDMGVQKCIGRYYTVFDINNKVPKNLIKTLNNLINHELKGVSMVKPIHKISGLIAQTSLHNIFGGNREMPISEKIIDAAKHQKKEDYIYTWEELWHLHE